MTVKICLLKSNNDFDMEYTYIVPERFVSEIDVGVFVTVPFGKGNSLREALVVSKGTAEECNLFKIKEIHDVIRNRDRISEDLVDLCRRMQQRYLCSFGNVLSLMLPPENTKKRSVKYAELSIPEEETLSILSGNVLRGIKQIRCLEALLNADDGVLSLDMLQKDFDVSVQSVEGLVKKGFVTIYEAECNLEQETTGDLAEINAYPVHELNKEQRNAFNKIKGLVATGKSFGMLLHGVTGSGKTEVYLHAIKHVVDSGGSAIMLVPEISLTPQIVARFKSRFGASVAVLHSRLTVSQKRTEYEKIKKGLVNIVIGARSAVFAPCKNLRLIILDEEQEPSYKSYDSTPYYSADEVAFMRSDIGGCGVILGSATPRVTTYYKSKSGELEYSYLEKRASDGCLPSVKIVNTREVTERVSRSVFSKTLLSAMKKNYEDGRQTILFVPRRGFAGRLICCECGKAMVCRKCGIPMTFHKKSHRLVCHYCGNTIIAPEFCPACGGVSFDSKSIGTEAVENELKVYFPNAEVIRMDADTTAKKEGHRLLLEKFEKENVPFLVGTQMIAKGLDFPNVTLVGVLNTDGLLNIQEYTAGERTFQLLTQVFGRAGRRESCGFGILQTMLEGESVYINSIRQDYKSFYESEIAFRKHSGYPPFMNICEVTVSGTDDKETFSLASELQKSVSEIVEEKITKENIQEICVFKVTRTPIPKINDRYRWMFNIKASYKKQLLAIMKVFVYGVVAKLPPYRKKKFRISFDIE